jgi:hypothetical protein
MPSAGAGAAGTGAAGQGAMNAPTAEDMAANAATAPAAAEAGTEAGGSANPNMLGDYLQVPSPALKMARALPSLRRGPAFQRRAGPAAASDSDFEPDEDEPINILTYVARSAFKITDDESPRPQDRVFLRYNYFNDVGEVGTDIHREVIGFEKTFLDGNASIGMRLPFVEIQGDPTVRQNGVGDLSIIFKYALINNCDTHNVLSAGMVLTVPTGSKFEPEFSPDIHPVLFQPWVGGIYNLGSAYIQGFSSVLIPAQTSDVTLLFNDLGVGYYVYRCQDNDSLLTFIAPTVETHVTTPLNHRSDKPVPDIVDLTYGVTLGIGCRSTLALGFVTPLTGPSPFDFEGQAYLNLKF